MPIRNLGGLLLIAGVAIADRDRADDSGDDRRTVRSILSAVFLILSYVCGGASKTSPA